MSNNKKLSKWLEAARILGEDPNQKVLCPKCELGYLLIEDVTVESEKKCVRHLSCPNCNEYVAFTFLID
jgi:hypothetical protein